MGRFSNYWKKHILDRIFGKKEAISNISTAMYLGLSKADPLDDGSGLSEPSGKGYARKYVPDHFWETASCGTTTNSVDITFALATEDWGCITHFALFDKKEKGHLLASGAVGQEQPINCLTTVIFESGTLSISLD